MSIEDLEKKNFGNPDDAPTELVRRCLELCRQPIDKFTLEDLRLMIGQGFSLQYLIPMALQYLKDDIYVEADFYPGDLLNNVLWVDARFWVLHRELWKEVNELIKDKR